MKPLRILGVDPGTIALGWGVIDWDGHSNQLIDFGVIRTPSKATLDQRLLVIFEGLKEIIDLIRWRWKKHLWGRIPGRLFG